MRKNSPIKNSPIKKSLMMGAAALLIAGGVASAQLAVPPGQDLQREDLQRQDLQRQDLERQDLQRDEMQPSTGAGYGAPYSPRNAPAADESAGLSTDGRATNSQAPTFEDRWPAYVGVPYLPPDAPIPAATTGQVPAQRPSASKDVPYSPD
jgi:hypothetical protein